MCVCTVSGGVRGDGQPTRCVHLLFPLRAQHGGALRVEERLVQDSDRHHGQYECRWLDMSSTEYKQVADLGDERTGRIPGSGTGRFYLLRISSSSFRWNIGRRDSSISGGRCLLSLHLFRRRRRRRGFTSAGLCLHARIVYSIHYANTNTSTNY